MRRLSGGRGATGVAALVALAAAAGFLYVELLVEPGSPYDPSAADLRSYYYPMLRWGFARLATGALPLWNPYQSCGTPFAAIPNISLFYPLYAPFLVLPAARALELDLVLHLALAAFGMFLLCRHAGMAWAASLVAGLAFAFQGSTMVKVYFPDLLAPVAWIPLLFLLVDRLLLRPSARACALLGAAAGVSVLGANVQMTYFTAWALVPFVAVRSLVIGRRAGAAHVGRAAGALVAAAALSALLASVRLVPTAEYIAETWRPPGKLGEEAAGIMALPPWVFRESVLTPTPPAAGGRWVDPASQAYAGTVTLALAMAGLVCWRRRSLALPIAVAGVAAVVYAFGRFGIVYPLVYALPGGSWFRGPDRGLSLFGFAVAFLAGAGLDVILRGERRWAWTAGVASLALVLALGLAYGAPRGTVALVTYATSGALLLSLLARVRRAREVSLVALALLVMFDLVHAQQHRGALPSQLTAYFARYDGVFAAIRARQRFERTYVWSTFGRDPLFFSSDIAKAGLNHGVFLPTDYESLVGARMDRYLDMLGPDITAPELGPIGYRPFLLTPENVALARLLGVRFYVVADGREVQVADEAVRRDWRVMLRADGVTVFEDAAAVPRAFVARGIERVHDRDAILSRLASADPRAIAFVEDDGPELPPSPAPGKQSAAEIVSYAPERVVIDTSAEAAGLLVLTDQYAADWHATVDGTAVPIYRTDFLFRGVPLPPGRHRVEMVYRPASYALGAAGSVVGLAALVVLLRRRPQS